MADVDLSVVPYGNNVDNCEPQPPVRYKECMRNHAAAIGGHANDGCGEFMPSATVSGSSLSCAACGCHRNFHRREVHHHNHHRQLVLLASPPHATTQHTPRVVSPYNVGPKWVGLDSNLHLARVDGEDNVDGDGEDYDRRSETPEREVVDPVVSPAASAEGRSGGKRFRTKFTAEQKERMVEFAERLGWRVQCQDDGEINRFCNEIGVKRQVLKVWMHNNKNNQRRKMETQSSSAVDTAPPPPLQHAGI